MLVTHACRRLAASALLLLLPAAASAQFDSVGSLQFPTSARSAEAQQYFLRGVAILHSFGWKQAIEQFRAAQEIEPDFALAYWGETLCYNHPLFRSDPDDENPRAALARLGSTPAERLAKAPTARERGFLEAVEALWGEGGDYSARRVAYMHAMERLYEQFPDDHEVASFYALALLSGSRALGDQSGRLEVQAGAIALEVFGDNPNHPGAPHYAIHAFDDPLHAPLALPAARQYTKIAPAVAHARHMPTHIFIQHGLWDLVSEHNQSAYDAARALWNPGDSVGDTVHPLDWGQYGDLQRGDYARSRTWLDRLEMVIDESDGAQRAVDTLPLLDARHVVETEEWRIDPIADDSSDHTLLATGLSAIRLGDVETARRAATALEERAAGDSKPVRIMHFQVAALVAAAEGRGADGTALMDEAIAVAETMRPPNGAANPVKPPYELYGELLLDLDQPDAAAEKFEHSLLRMPGRTRSLLGAARAAAASGDVDTAYARYAALRDNWRGEANHPVIAEARAFTATDNAAGKD